MQEAGSLCRPETWCGKLLLLFLPTTASTVLAYSSSQFLGYWVLLINSAGLPLVTSTGVLLSSDALTPSPTLNQTTAQELHSPYVHALPASVARCAQALCMLCLMKPAPSSSRRPQPKDTTSKPRLPVLPSVKGRDVPQSFKDNWKHKVTSAR